MNDRFTRLSGERICLAIAQHPRKDYRKKIESAGICACYFSDDEGKTWRVSNWIVAVESGGHLAEPIIVELSDHRLKMFMRNTTGFLHVSVSKNGGETWQPETATAVRMLCSPFIVKQDTFSGYFFLAWDRSFPGRTYQYPRNSFWLAVSRDGGESWMDVTELEGRPDYNYGYPTMYFTEDILRRMRSCWRIMSISQDADFPPATIVCG